MNMLRLISDADADLLRKYAGLVTVDGTCVEVGCCHGASTLEILSTLPPQYDLVCSSLHSPDDYFIFRKNCIDHGAWSRVVPVTGCFRKLHDHVQIAKLAFLFLDHDHSESGMRDALAKFLPLCVSGTWLIFHDYRNTGYPAVVKYVDALPDTRFRKVEIIDTMAVLQAL